MPNLFRPWNAVMNSIASRIWVYKRQRPSKTYASKSPTPAMNDADARNKYVVLKTSLQKLYPLPVCYKYSVLGHDSGIDSGLDETSSTRCIIPFPALLNASTIFSIDRLSSRTACKAPSTSSQRFRKRSTSSLRWST